MHPSEKRQIMPDSFRISKFALLVFLLMISSPVHSQKLIESRQTSYFTYIYKLTDDEAGEIYKKEIWKVDPSFFHTLVDSFPTDGQYLRTLPAGHYIKTFSEKNKQMLLIASVPEFDVKILNNNTDLCIQVYDLKGNIISEADVKVRLKNLRFDSKTQSYIDKKSDQKGLLKVGYKGYTAFYNLGRQYKNSLAKRATRKIIYRTPLKYIWMPVNYVIYLPVDGVKSIIKGWPQGTISRTKNFFVKTCKSIACFFDDSNCDSYNNYRFQKKHTGYIVFNKPKYLPGDTVKFKAFLVTIKGKPVNRTINVVLNTHRKSIELTHLKPYREGGYAYQFYLHDSLGLLLDRDYDVYLQLNDRKEYINGSFGYEDYELSKNKLEVRLDDDKQFKGKEYKVYAKGTDENNLNLLDARLEILVKPKEVTEYFDKHVFIPDTLYFTKKKLESADETVFTIPDSIFPNTNLTYKLQVRLLTSDNEAITESKDVDYFHLKKEFDITLQSDSLLVIYNETGKPKAKDVNLSAVDNFGNITELQNQATPCKILVNPYFREYRVKSDSLKQTFEIYSQPALLKCLSERTKDSIFIVVENPRKIPFTYNIYKKNNEQARGFSDSLSISRETSGKQNYFVSIRYLWGGKIKEENYRIPYIDKTLNLAVTQPKVVYPGQKTKIEILVTDKEGKPVQDVDLTAFSLTKKFGYEAPELPYLGKEKKNKEVINNFSFKEINLDVHPGLNLDYEQWKLLAGLDSIEYYRFIFPVNHLYTFEYVADDKLTQFAPFVVSDGAIKPIHVIYLDGKPVYFSWSTNIQPYSFLTDSGFHQIMLRTKDQNITLDSIYFNYGKKLIFSLNDDLLLKNIRIEKTEPVLSASEKRLLYKYIFPYRNTFGEKYAYIEQGNQIQFLKPSGNNFTSSDIAGPVAGNVTFNLLDGFSAYFNHEPFFEYDFAAGLIKMRTIDEKVRYPQNLSYINSKYELSDLVLTREKLFRQWKDYTNDKRYLTARYKYPNSTSSGAGKLQIEYTFQNKTKPNIPINILVFRYDNHQFLRVYQGNTSLIHQLDRGLHKLIFFFPDSKYFIVDSLDIQPDGLNYYQIMEPFSLKKDTFSVEVSNLIEETIFKQVPYTAEEEKELRQIFNTYQQQFKYTGDGTTVEGYVYEAGTKEPLPGVNVIVMGTTYGTATDINGHYSLKLPPDCDILQFLYIGYRSQEVNVGNKSNIDVQLNADVLALQEVVVVGYGVQKKSSMTGSVTTITTSSLLGGIPGVSSNIVQALQGKSAGIQIVSDSTGAGGAVSIRIRGMATTEFAKTPLYIINGVVYTGDISALSPDLIENIEILKDDNATAIYGSLGSNGVVLINTKGGSFQPTGGRNIKGADYDNTFFETASKSSSIRENFSDYAFWKPELISNKEGKASFEVTFPDDVTSWETYYLAMNDKRQSGQTESIIKSYKPLMAQLSVPRFLVQTDTTFAIGKIVNYTSDSIDVTTNYEIDGKNEFSKKQICINSILDTLAIKAQTDSINVKYYLEKPDGYFDGEQKRIPVYPIGLEETRGSFILLEKDTTLKMSFDSTLGKVSLYARASLINVVDDEISHLISYRYSCNEQLASKLKALLSKKLIAENMRIEFKDDREVEKILDLLLKNQKENGLWGWWKNSNNSYWISLHVLEALSQARQMGFTVKLNEAQMTENLIWELETNKDFSTKSRILRILRLFGSKINLSTYIKDLERIKNLSLNNYLQLLELKQLCNLSCRIDTLKSFQKETFFGNLYYSDDKVNSDLLDNDIQNTILAYRILRHDTLTNPMLFEKIRNYFLETKRDGYWQNTYESSQIIETILPDLMVNKNQLQKSVLVISGDVSKTITDFPFQQEVGPAQRITISKTGDFPVYLTTYQHFWNEKPQVRNSDLIITSKFNNDSLLYLKAGQETKLIVNLEVKKDADYIMINIPVPGGCSYADKGNYFKNEVHREYFKNETTIFCEQLKKGNYSFGVNLIPRYSGKYTLNPAKVELMYFPTFNANNELKRVIIK